MTAGQQFDASDPLVIEISFDVGTSIAGLGLPPDIYGTGQISEGVSEDLDMSIVQVQLPAQRDGDSDPDDRVAWGVSAFDPPRFCRLGSPCVWTDEVDGRWRAWRIRDEGAGPTATEVQLATVAGKFQGTKSYPNRSIFGLWLASTDLPLDPFDRIRLEYVGNVPRLANAWSETVLRPRVRVRETTVDTASLSCAALSPDCWHALRDVEGLTIESDQPTFVKAMVPLDTQVGVPFDVRFVVTDEWGNPAPVTGSVQPMLDGAPWGPPRTLTDAWAVDMVGQVLSTEGMHRIEIDAIGAMTRVAAVTSTTSAAPTYRRYLGDVHIHSSDGASRLEFAPVEARGDHQGQFTRSDVALRYLDEVAGLDFGALSEHSVPYAGWSLPSPQFDTFLAGGDCEVDSTKDAMPTNWWRLSQEVGYAYQTANPDIVLFPAYEWHSKQTADSRNRSKLHRVVLFRNFDTAGPHAWPMLPGTTDNRLAQCVVGFLRDAGIGPDQALVMPHVMHARGTNPDWDQTYASPDPTAHTVASLADLEAYMTVGEIFSARNNATGRNRWMLDSFEGSWTDPADKQVYTWRYGWTLGARIGLIGASDNHVQMPGVNDDIIGTRRKGYHAHEPGGYAVALVDPALPLRDGIYEAIRARRTYATSGLRSWLDVTLDTGDGVAHPMGSNVRTVSSCSATLNVDIAVERTIREIQIMQAKVSTGSGYTTVYSMRPDAPIHTVNQILPNPATVADEVDDEWLYYVRAFIGAPLSGDPAGYNGEDTDAVWSSPIWVNWSAPCAG